jgi:desulfoferrodoxin (superoxide reductase-like protein)
MNVTTRNILLFMIPGILSWAIISCTDSGTGTEKNEIKFYSAAHPGIWTSQAADHEPEVTITRVDDRKILNVNIPFARQKEKNHYVEVIVILDLDRKELKKVSFQKGRASKGAKFDFPDNFHTPVYVVMKCNKHDMWEKLVDWSE